MKVDKQMESERSKYLDLVKGLTILLVVVGHCIQFGSGSEYLGADKYFENIVFKLIYSFHMPLFAMISGYLYWNSVQKRTFWQTVVGKLKTIFVPIVVWGTISFAVTIFENGVPGNVMYLLSSYFWTITGTLWFLWALSYCYVTVAIIHYVLKDQLILYISLIVVFLITPDQLNLGRFKFLFPAFVIGYMWNKYNVRERLSVNKKSTKFIVGVGCLAYIVLLQRFTNDYYIYTTGVTLLGCNSILSQLDYDFTRWIIVIVGSGLVLLAIYCLVQGKDKLNFAQRKMVDLGRKSLGIYIINNYLNQYILKVYLGKMTFSYLYIIIETILVLILCYLLTAGIEKIKPMSKLLLGK